jgi:hypothetical protein
MINARCPLLLVAAAHAASGPPDQLVSGSGIKLPGGVHAVVCEPQWCAGPTGVPTLLARPTAAATTWAMVRARMSWE